VEAEHDGGRVLEFVDERGDVVLAVEVALRTGE